MKKIAINITINYIGIDGEIHCGTTRNSRNINSKYEDPENGEYYGIQYYEDGKEKIRIIYKDEFLVARGKKLGLIKEVKTLPEDQIEQKELKPSVAQKNKHPKEIKNEDEDKYHPGGCALWLWVFSLIIGFPLAVFDTLSLFGVIGDFIKLFWIFLPGLFVAGLSNNGSTALKWSGGSLIVAFLSAMIFGTIFGKEFAVVTFFWTPLITCFVFLYISIHSGNSGE